MNTDGNSLEGLDDCGCAEGLTAATPVLIENRPGLSVVGYRTGTHARFMHSMLARLSASDLPELADLRTRDRDDLSIALLDGWATIADVLTFYQERIANEGYLRTATERLSLLEMARLIGYELSPGVAANTFLAFSLETTPGAPEEVTIEPGLKVQSTPGPDEVAQTFETTGSILARAGWNAIKAHASQTQSLTTLMATVWLEGRASGLAGGNHVLIIAPDGGGFEAILRRVKNVSIPEAPPSPGTAGPSDMTRIDLEPSDMAAVSVDATAAGVYALHKKVGAFGNNAPLQVTSVSEDGVATFGEWNLNGEVADELSLDGVYDGIQTDSWIVIDREDPDNAGDRQHIFCSAETVRTRSIAKYGMGGRVTHLNLSADWKDAGDSDLGVLREMVVHAESESLALAEQPITALVAGNTIELDGLYEDLVKGQAIAISTVTSDDDPDAPKEIAIIADIVNGARTSLTLENNLKHSYAPEATTINANVVPATHGESVSEILGSGDATRTYPEFALRQNPLTHVTAATPSGTESSLEVRVNDIRWHEVPTLFGAGPDDPVYITRLGDDGTTKVMMGDGVNGGRLPTGDSNVVANYRKGLGLAGRLKAGRLNLLMSRPLGVEGAINPEPTEGGDDPEIREDARQNAPLTVLTLDRAVSLQDYEDFARAYAGIRKALATWTWDGRARGVFLTIAGPDGAAVEAGGKTYDSLLTALQQAGDPHVRIQMKTFRAAFFRLKAKIKVDPDHLVEKVFGDVETTLRAAFSFETRAFGQPVVLSEIYAAIQSTPGVVAADIDKLYRVGMWPILNHRLLADQPVDTGGGELDAAELLTLDPEPLDQLSEMT